MATKITEIEDAERGKIVLRVEGSLEYDDAVLLEKIALGLREKNGRNLTLDLSDIHFMDSESAPVVKRLEREHGFEIEGVEYFLQRVVAESGEKLNAKKST